MNPGPRINEKSLLNLNLGPGKEDFKVLGGPKLKNLQQIGTPQNRPKTENFQGGGCGAPRGAFLGTSLREVEDT